MIKKLYIFSNQELYHNYLNNHLVVLKLNSKIYYERFIKNEFYCIHLKKTIDE
jgi:hypothetical protein